jgi:very-short-patch-repair endonuclease
MHAPDPYKPDLHVLAAKLRRNQTDAEKLIWSLLRNNQLGCKFRRQHPIDNYILDFVCLDRQLVIELDGGQHSLEKDKARTDHIAGQGFRILRIWNNDVLQNTEGVFEAIYEALYDPSPQPSPTRGEGV